MNYLVKATAVCPKEKGDTKHKVREFHLLTDTISYTDAEATGVKFFEDNLKKLKYSDFTVTKIATESFNVIKDTLNVEDDADFSMVFKAKIAYGIDEDKKKQGAVVLVRANTIEEAGEAARLHILELRRASFANLVEIKETPISPLSPIFNKD